MAGGFGSKGAPLYARTRAGPDTGFPSSPSPVSPPSVSRPSADDRPARGSERREECPARHCWVTSPVDGGSPRPGLLLEWRRGVHGWEGRVAYAAELRAARWGTVEEWLPAQEVASVERTAPPHREPGPL